VMNGMLWNGLSKYTAWDCVYKFVSEAFGGGDLHRDRDVRHRVQSTVLLL